MRRSVIFYLGGAVVVLILSAVFTWADSVTTNRRYHQHLEQPNEAELGECDTCDGTVLCTHLPIINIETGGVEVPGRPITDDEDNILGYETAADGSETIWVSVSTVDRSGVWHHAEDNPANTSQAIFRVRGNTSRFYDKPNYIIKLAKNNDPEQKNPLPLLGMAQGDEWALHGPFLDKTLMRSYVWMNLSAEIMGDAPDVRYCELILDGNYQGVYVLMENIRVEEERLQLTRYSEGDPVMSYLARLDYNINPEKELNSFYIYTYKNEMNTGMELIYPGYLRQTEAVHNYVNTNISEIEKTLYSHEMLKGTDAYRQMVEADSFVDYYLINEFLALNDMFSASTYFHRDARGKLTIGPVWDFNNALDNYIRPMPAREFLLSQRGWYGKLMTDEDFVEHVISRWQALREGILSEDNILKYNTDVELWLGSAVTRNYEVWGYSFDPDRLESVMRRRPNMSDEELSIYDVNPSSYSEAMEWMLDFIDDRGSWMDRHIESLRQYSHFSRNIFKNHRY